MAANDDVLIVGKLDSKELEKSINDLIDFVGDKTTIMAGKFDSAMDKMKSAMKDFAITQKVSVDLMKEAWKDMSVSFDAMFKAQSDATGGGKGSGKPTYASGTLGYYEQLIKVEEERRRKMKMGTDELRQQNVLIEKMRSRVSAEKETTLQAMQKYYAKQLQAAISMPTKELSDAEKKLQRLLSLQSKVRGTAFMDETKINRLQNAIDNVRTKIERLKNSAPKTIKQVLGMDESSVDAVAKKMRALRTVTVNPQNKSEVAALGNEYQRLSRLQSELLGKGIQLTHSNNYLAQSLGYIRNRIVYAMTLGAVTNFVKQMYDVRGQYEMLERSLGILIDDMRRGSELFNELNAMAIKSPFTLVELATGAKQLLAYNFAEEEVVDTTRRLADISAALGVPMERLVYNLGQIRAQTVLTARDARDFANAGLAIVPMLAQMYTEEKRFGNEIVTTAQVFDMMSNKMVSYADVMKIINSVTDEGGKFFDFQAKQAETLRVKMANLTLAWNNMLNEIGAENQSALTLPVNGLKLLFEHWRMIYEIVRDVAIMYGIYRARAILVAAVNGTLITQGIISGMFQLGRAVGFVASAWRILSAAVAANPIGAIATVLATAAVSFGLLNDNVAQAAEYQEKFGKAGAKTVSDLEMYFDTLANISHESSNYKKVMGELNSILGEYDMELVKETDTQEQLNDKRRIAIQLIKEEILERKHLNEVEQGRSEYEAKVENVRKKLREDLSDAITENFLGIGTINEEIAENAPAIANIISDVIENNISAIAGKTGDEYQKGVEKIFAEINSRMKAIGISESTLNKGWLKNSMFRMFEDDIISDAINNIARAKEELDSYTEAIDNAYEAEKKAAEDGANFNDRVEQTQRRLMDAANDTDKFAKKIESLLRQYGGENIIDFLVKVKTEVPAWMSQKGLTELTQLSARFTALATQAKKAGKDSLNVNGTEFSVEQLFQRAAQYSQAAQNKARDIESRKSATITKEASNALKEYKSALDAVAVAKNRVKQGTADNSLVTEKETEAQAKYNKALKAGVSLEELKNAKKGKNKGSKKDPLGDALTKEIQLITEMQKLYKDYQKAGVDADKARIASSNEYKKSLIAQNNVLKSFGIKGLDSSELVKMDARQLRDYYKNLREIASVKGNTKGIEALEKAISNLNVEITKVDYKKITDGLNNELGKLKDEYELAVELYANPEFGSMFADLMGIDMSDLPRTAQEYAKEYTSILNKYLKDKKSDIELPNLLNITNDDLREFQEQANKDAMSQEWVDNIKKGVLEVRGIFKKEKEDTSRDWNTLIEKYGGLQAKLLKIYKDNVQQQASIVREFGTNNEQIKALDLVSKIKISQDPTEIARLQEELAKVMNDVTSRNSVALKTYQAVRNEQESQTGKAYWEDFKDSELYSITFTDMANNSTQAIQMIINKLNELKDKVKEDPASMKALIKSLEDAEGELISRDPFAGISNSISTWIKATKEQKDAQKELEQANIEVAGSEIALKKAQSVGDKVAIAKAEEKLAQAQQKQVTAQGNVVQSGNRAKKAQEQLKTSFQNLSNELGNVSGLLGSVSQIFRAVGDDDTADAIDAINQGFTIMTTVISAVTAALIILQSSNPWLLAMAAALSVIVGLVSFLSGNSNKKITEQVEASERAVKRLELAYIDLQQAVDKAYGTATIGAKQATLANKELQLAEIQRQIQLEKSRTGKNRDEDKIIDLQKQYKELFYEIKNGYTEIVDDLMGTDVASFAENLVSSMIDAFKQGEDYMKVFSDKFDEMIDNMIMKSIVSRVVSQYLDAIWSDLDKKINERTKDESDDLAKLQNRATEVRQMSDDEIRREIAFANGRRFDALSGAYRDTISQAQVDQYRKIAEDELSAAQKRLDAASAFTDSDVDYVMERITEVMPELGEKLQNILGEYYKFGESSETQLSALQQGLQSMSESTANALEGYMNGVSQQVYYQSDLLTQIRDAVVGFNLDVQVASMSQMLLQLQQSYQVQLAIQNILNGWSNPSGMAVRVEMV